MPLTDGDITNLAEDLLRTHSGEIIRQVHDQLIYLHKYNMYYLDLKPENIMYIHNKKIDKYRFYIGDIGSLCVKGLDRTSTYTAPGYSSRFHENIDDDLSKHVSWLLGYLYLYLLVGRDQLKEYSLKLPSAGKWDSPIEFFSNYTMEHVKQLINEGDGFENMMYFLNKCKSCRPSITEDIDEYLTNVEKKHKTCAACDIIDTYICKFCGETAKFSHYGNRHG